VSGADLAYHRTRLPYDPKREVLWRTLWEHYFRRLVKPADTVLELGAGYAHFINQVRCARRIAVDLWPGLREYAGQGVLAHIGSVTDLSFLDDESVDLAFASNLFEHLSQDAFAEVLCHLGRKLKPSGSLTILQPNYRYAYREYFDDYTHVTVFSDASLCDFLEAHQFRVVDRQPAFLPLTVKSRWPVHPLLIRLYLASPIKPFAKQMLIRAVPHNPR
jgi:SAM-dependent methyltransferase